MKTKIVFVCLGNICRSPMAEGIFLKLIKDKKIEANFEIDSAGTAAYHVGNLPDSRMRECAISHNISLLSKARQFTKNDLSYYDYILVMDKSNFNNIITLAQSQKTTNVHLMRNYDPQPGNNEVPDPYYGGIQGFEEVYQILTRSCEHFLKSLLK